MSQPWSQNLLISRWIVEGFWTSEVCHKAAKNKRRFWVWLGSATKQRQSLFEFEIKKHTCDVRLFKKKGGGGGLELVSNPKDKTPFR
jgi:hypothetical protein